MIVLLRLLGKDDVLATLETVGDKTETVVRGVVLDLHLLGP